MNQEKQKEQRSRTRVDKSSEQTNLFSKEGAETIEAKSDKNMYMVYGKEKDIRSFLDKNPAWKKELSEGEKRNVPFTPYTYGYDLKVENERYKDSDVLIREFLFTGYWVVIEPDNKKFILWDDIHPIMTSREAFKPDNLAKGADIDACFEMILLEVAKERSDLKIVMCDDHSMADKDAKIVDGRRTDSLAAAIRYIYHTPELRDKVFFYDGDKQLEVPWEKNPKLWKSCSRDFGMDLSLVAPLTQSKSLPQDKSAQLPDLASRHNQKSLTDFINGAKTKQEDTQQHKELKAQRSLGGVSSKMKRSGTKKDSPSKAGQQRIEQLKKDSVGHRESLLLDRKPNNKLSLPRSTQHYEV